MDAITEKLTQAFGAGSRILVLDMETTGLADDPRTTPLELGGILVNPVTQEVYDEKVVLIRSADALLWASDAERARQCGEELHLVQKMHLGNGLVEELLDESASDGELLPSIGHADRSFAAWINGLDFGEDLEEKPPLVGASVGSLDRPMILRHFPAVNASLLHRNVDTSSLPSLIGLFDRATAKDLSERSKALSVQHGLSDGHRTLADCRDALLRLRFLMVESGLADALAARRARLAAEAAS